MGLLKVIFSGISKIILTKTVEFKYDISLPIDIKGNELYSIENQQLHDGKFKGIVDSDMLKLELPCANVELEEMS